MNILQKIENSFLSILKGQETIDNVIWYWGAIAYLFCFFVLNKMILAINSRFFDVSVSLIGIIYFSWHIYALYKCSPKKPKLSAEEKKQIKAERRKDLGKKFMRKILLQESFTKWNPTMICGAIDLCFITHYYPYV